LGQESGEEEEALGLGQLVKAAWNKRKARQEHGNAIAGWAISMIPEIREDVNQRMTGEQCNAIECIILCLHAKLCPSPTKGVDKWSDSKIIDMC